MVWTIEGFDAPTFKQFAKRLKAQLGAGDPPVDIPLHALHEAMARTLKAGSFHAWEQAQTSMTAVEPTELLDKSATPTWLDTLVARLLAHYQEAADRQKNVLKNFRYTWDDEGHNVQMVAALSSVLQALVKGPAAASEWFTTHQLTETSEHTAHHQWNEALEVLSLVLDQAPSAERGLWADVALGALSNLEERASQFPRSIFSSSSLGLLLKASGTATDPNAWSAGLARMAALWAREGGTSSPVAHGLNNLLTHYSASGRHPSEAMLSPEHPLVFLRTTSGLPIAQRLKELTALGLHPGQVMQLFFKTHDPEVLSVLTPEESRRYAPANYAHLLQQEGAADANSTRFQALMVMMTHNLPMFSEQHNARNSLLPSLLAYGSPDEQALGWAHLPSDPAGRQLALDLTLELLVAKEARAWSPAHGDQPAQRRSDLHQRTAEDNQALLDQLMALGAQLAESSMKEHWSAEQLTRLPEAFIKPILAAQPRLGLYLLEHGLNQDEPQGLQHLPEQVLQGHDLSERAGALLLSAVRHHHLVWLKRLLEAGARPNQEQYNLVHEALRPLRHAASPIDPAHPDSLDILRTVLQYVPVETEDSLHRFGSPLMAATEPVVVDLLVRHGARLDHRAPASSKDHPSAKGKTPAEYWVSVGSISHPEALVAAAEAAQRSLSSAATALPASAAAQRRPKM